MWVLSSYKHVREVMADEGTFSAAAERASYSGLCARAKEVLAPINFEQLYGLSTTENPDHDRVKLCAAPVFREHFATRLQPTLEDLAHTYVLQLAGKQLVDLVPEVFATYPAVAIALMLGVKAEDVSLVLQYAASRLILTWGEAESQVHHAQQVVRYWEFTCELVDRKIRAPEDDLTSELGRCVGAGELTVQDVRLLCYGLLFSGHATTSAFLSEACRLMIESNLWSRVASGENSIEETVDEMLRYCPSAFTRRRVALKGVRIGDFDIAVGDVLLLSIGSANRDELVFSRPNEFQIGRVNAKKHLTFGHGFHYCIGARLVKLEYAALLGALMRAYPEMQTPSGYQPVYRRNLSIRSLTSLPVFLRPDNRVDD